MPGPDGRRTGADAGRAHPGAHWLDRPRGQRARLPTVLPALDAQACCTPRARDADPSQIRAGRVPSEVEDLVYRGYHRAWNEGDLEGLLELADEDIVLRPSGKIVDLAHEYRGHEGVRRFWSDLRAPWEQLSIDVEK